MTRTFSFLNVFLILLLSLIFGGCIGGTSQPSVYYVFNASLEQSTAQSLIADQGLGVGPIKLPEFLKRPQIVKKQGGNVLDINEFHRWGDSFEAQISSVLVENLSALLNTPNVHAYPWERPFIPGYQLYIDFRHFEGQTADSVSLEAVWWIVEKENETTVLTRQTSLIEPTGQKGYQAYVVALNTTLEKLCQQIAKAVIDTLH
jgi:uncharacterized lipoprotein YmbA